MKFQIIKKMSLISTKMIFKVRMKYPLWPFWRNLQYQGVYMTSYSPEFDTIEEAQMAIDEIIKRSQSKQKIV